MSEPKNGGAARPINVADVPMIERSVYPPELALAVKGRQKQGLGDLFGLSQFGVNRITLQPGAKSSLRHWHSQEDEFVLVLAGELILIDDDGEKPMRPGDCIGFKGGSRNAHHVINRSATAGVFLVVGSRMKGDTGFYPDDDLMWVHTPDGLAPARKNGSFYGK